MKKTVTDTLENLLLIKCGISFNFRGFEPNQVAVKIPECFLENLIGQTLICLLVLRMLKEAGQALLSGDLLVFTCLSSSVKTQFLPTKINSRSLLLSK